MSEEPVRLCDLPGCERPVRKPQMHPNKRRFCCENHRRAYGRLVLRAIRAMRAQHEGTGP